MRRVKYTTRFSRDLKREGKSPKNSDLSIKLQDVIDLLAGDESIPANMHDHALSGEFMGTRELHIRPDLLLIYRKVGEHSLELIRLGSHSELF